MSEINHKDEDATNNIVSNLEWCNHKYNCNYGTRIERTTKKISKIVLCIDTNITYPSASEASRQTQIPESNISRACTGIYKSAGKLHWRYVN